MKITDLKLEDAQLITDKQELFDRMNNDHAEYFYSAYFENGNPHQVDYYIDDKGRIFKCSFPSKPIKDIDGNRASVESEMKSVEINIRNFVRAVTEGFSENETDRSATKTRHPIEKLKTLLAKRIKDQNELDNEHNYLIAHATHDLIVEQATICNLSAIEIIDRMLAVPQMQENPANEKLKNALEAIKLEIQLRLGLENEFSHAIYSEEESDLEQ